MNKTISKVISFVLILMTVLNLIPITAHAATKSVVLESHSGYSYVFNKSFPAPFGNTLEEKPWWTFKISGNPVYCIEYGHAVSTGDTFDNKSSVGYLNAKQKKLLQKALIFGYNEKTGAIYGGSWLDNAMATQAMIWIITENQYGTSWESKIADKLLKDNAKARKIYDKLKSNTEKSDTIPSFAASADDKANDYEMKYNMNTGVYELAFEDKNGVLEYFDFSSAGISIEKRGNELFLLSEKAFDTKTIKANKKLPDGFVNGIPEYWVNPDKQDFASIDFGGKYTVSAFLKLHTQKLGNIKLKKTAEDGIVSGLRFRIVGNGIDRVFTTESDGTIRIDNLVPGDYSITEVDTPNKYVQPKTQTVTVKASQTTSVSFDNILKKFNIRITKRDSETGDTPQGDASLNGAEYEIYNSQGYLVEQIKADGQTAISKLLPLGTYKIYEVVAPKGYTLNKEPIIVQGDFDGQTVEIGRTDTSISDEVIKGRVGIIKFADKPLLEEAENSNVKQPLKGIEFTLTLKSTGEEACKIVTDENGYAITPELPYGLYHIEETTGKEGYRKIEPFDIMIDTDEKINQYILENPVYESKVKIVKVDAETGKQIPLAGTQFKIKDSAGNWVTQKINYPVPTVLDTFETAEDGTLVLPKPLKYGAYELYEVKAPYGYTLSSEPIPFSISSENPSATLEVVCTNTPVKGTITIVKQGERFVGTESRESEYGKIVTPIYEMQGLEGVTFDILAAEDIITPDGTIRYRKGMVVDTVTTDKDGKAESKELYLGKYQAVEKNTLNGFILDKQAHAFELTYQDQNTKIVSASSCVENKRQKARVSLYKEMETINGQKEIPYKDVAFGLYAKEDIQTSNNEIGIEKDSLLDVIHIDKQGNGIVTVDLPLGNYYVKELSTGKGYSLDTSEYGFEFRYMGNAVAEIPIHLNDGKPIRNSLMKGGIEITKTSEDNRIEGINFKVKGKTEVGTDYENTFKTDKDGKTVNVKMDNKLIRGGFKLLKTDENGIALSGVKFGLFKKDGTKLQEFITGTDGTYVMSDLLYGDYYLQELEAKKGYTFDKEEIYAFTVSENEQIIEIHAVNDRIPSESINPKMGDSKVDKRFFILIGVSSVMLAGFSIFMYRRKKTGK